MGHGHADIYRIDYYASHSPLSGWNAAWKTVFSGMVLLACILGNKPLVPMVVCGTMLLFTTLAGRIPAGVYLALFRIPVIFLLLGSAAIAVDISTVWPEGAEAWLQIFGVYFFINAENVLRAVVVTLKALGAVSAMYMLVLSTPAAELIAVLRKWHVPALLIELMHMIYRFIFMMSAVYADMSTAAQARFGFDGFGTSIRTFGCTAANLFVYSLRKASLYYDALEARGYDGTLAFWEEEKPCRVWQVFLATVYLLALVLLLVLG